MRLLKDWQRKNWFHVLVQNGDDKLYDSSSIPRIYVLVRDDILPPLHQGIQAAHACIRLASSEPSHLRWINPDSYLILLGASEQEIRKWSKNKTPLHATYIDHGLIDPETGLPITTAIAFAPMSVSAGTKLFGHLRRSK